MRLGPQAKQILEWSGEPVRAMQDCQDFLTVYQAVKHEAFESEAVNAKRLLSVFGNSHFLSRFLLQYPLQADQIIYSSALEVDKKREDFLEELTQKIPDAARFSSDELGRELRFYKYQEFLRLTVKDLSQAAPLQSTLQELSSLAQALVEFSLSYFWNQLCGQWGQPFYRLEDGSQHICGFCVLAQGKLGGRELNYSSDIDLQYFYRSDEGGLRGQPDRSLHEFFVKLSQRLTQFLTQKADHGFLYRVDLNLRPEGKSGALANSLNALEIYYETFGQSWERQALIKAAPLAGDFELGESFLKMIEPFVWRKSLDLQTLDKLKEIKNKLHESVHKRNPKDFDVKLDPGGIREIEFFVQILQILYGGRHPELRVRSTLEGLSVLKQLKMIDVRDAEQLKDAYLFLRKLEHRLQMVDEMQTQLFPAEVEIQKSIARRMGYFEEDLADAREHFLDDLTRYRTIVKNAFDDLFEERG